MKKFLSERETPMSRSRNKKGPILKALLILAATVFLASSSVSVLGQGPINETIRLPFLHTSQLDYNQIPDDYAVAPPVTHVGDVYLFSLYPGNPTPTVKDIGCFWTSISMALQSFVTENENNYGQKPLPPGVNDFLALTNGMIPDLNSPIFWSDLTKLGSWQTKVVQTDSFNFSLHEGLSTKISGWPLGRAELDSFIIKSKQLVQNYGWPDNPMPWNYTDRIPIIIVFFPIDDNRNGITEKNEWIGHALVVTGWSKEDNTYLVHDPCRYRTDYMWDYRIETGRAARTNSLGSPFLMSYYSLKDFFSDPKLVTPADFNPGPGGLDAISWVDWVEDYFGKELISFTVILGSPAELLVTAPDGKRIGIDPNTGERVEEAEGYYYEQPSYHLTETEGKTLKGAEFRQPKEGIYDIQVLGTGNGPFEVMFNQGDLRFSGEITAGEMLSYEVLYSSTGVASASPVAPSVTTLKSELVGSNFAVLRGTVDPKGLATEARIEWSSDPAFASPTNTVLRRIDSDLMVPHESKYLVDGLQPNSTFYYRIVAENHVGQSLATFCHL
jgi:hypothetical protein